MMNALRTETENLCATHKLVCGCDILSQNSQSSRSHYDSFGNQVRHCDAPAAETSGSPFKLARLNPYRYAAREWLSLDWSAASALGLSDNRARFYDPTLASFLQEDPLWNSNPYTYVGNNPVYLVDPMGDKIVYKGDDRLVAKAQEYVEYLQKNYSSFATVYKKLDASTDYYYIHPQSEFEESWPGYYDRDTKEILFDADISTSDKLHLATIPGSNIGLFTKKDIISMIFLAHELRHAWQHMTSGYSLTKAQKENDAIKFENSIRSGEGVKQRPPYED